MNSLIKIRFFFLHQVIYWARCAKLMNMTLIVGYFGYESGQVDGQTIKTQNMYHLFDSRDLNDKVPLCYFDTEKFKKSRFYIFELLLFIFLSRRIFYLGAHNNLKYIFPLIFIVSKLVRADIHFVVVGGWLRDFLANKPLHRFMLSKIKRIYPETQLMTQELRGEYGFFNLTQLSNFRVLSSGYVFGPRQRDHLEIKIVYMGRVIPEKGLRTIFKIREFIESKSIDCISIDIYGPVSSEYEGEFFSDIEKSEGIIRYKGILEPNEIHKALTVYDLMLFPTQYFTEGFPGSILDAYIAGVPVIATKWKYADEFVVDNVSGIIVPFGDEERFISTVMTVIQDASLLQRLSVGAAEQVAKYTSESAWGVIKKYV